MVPIVQLVRASDCGSECRGFESHWAPKETSNEVSFFVHYGEIENGNYTYCLVPVDIIEW